MFPDKGTVHTSKPWSPALGWYSHGSALVIDRNPHSRTVLSTVSAMLRIIQCSLEHV